ncbi:MAG: hypothetical protein ABIN24_03750 [Dyadobacter sp.]
MANDLIIGELKKYQPKNEMLNVYKQLTIKECNSQTSKHINELSQISKRVTDLNERLKKRVKNLLLDEIYPVDFKIMKSDCENAIGELERKIVKIISQKPKNIENLLKKGLNTLLKLSYVYENSTTERKRNIINAIFPENLTFDGDTYRTTRVNEVVDPIYLLNRDLPENKNGTKRSRRDSNLINIVMYTN